MASNQVILVVFCGEIWKSLSTAAPQHTAMTESHTYTTARSPTADKPPLYQPQTTGPSLHQSGTALAVKQPQFTPEEEEAGDGSWVAALLIGIILIGMMTAVIVILLWKCCMKPALAESHWAGRSPFTDGDTPDLYMDSDHDTKRSSVLFMLPWKLKQSTNFQQDPPGSENPPHHTTSAENGQVPPPAEGCSGAGSAAPGTDPPPAPTSEPANAAGDSCPHPHTSSESPDLPPPPDWLREPSEDPSSDPSKHPALHLEAEEPLPPPPELLIQETHETLPQPEHPL
ncbi:EVI2B protein, partial [Ptilonorhynchus violaceus]|nr:EVI2B protein [Ptilonorhynchus violaceus]